ncbi:MAG: hypothetical protein HYT79_03200 [Elusimicrobia bacterium]|nr:hypothetical protein [Elusimicrobiota bacterium]
MKNAEKLKKAMVPGRVYRRQDLTGLTSAVDRDLKTLVERGEVSRLAGGLYCRPKETVFGAAPPDDRELVRAFLKTDDFLLTSYDNFNDLGLGLTQLYHTYIVYNHKRAGDFQLGNKHFKFRLVPAYPKAYTKEYLLVDLLNNLKNLPDDVSAVRRNLKSHLLEFDRDKMSECLERYGNSAAKRVFQEAYV